jgi:hypothetical protein
MIVAHGQGPHPLDPNWYRARYALAVNMLGLASLYAESATWFKRGQDIGWPRGIGRAKAIPLQRGLEKVLPQEAFGEETDMLIGNLHRERDFAKAPFEDPAAAAREEAEELVGDSANLLLGAGWRWVARRPPRFVRWKRAPGRWLSRSPQPDQELIRFLSWVVEPASVILAFSAWSLAGRSFPLERLDKALAERQEYDPLDRRSRELEGEQWLFDYLGRLAYDTPLGTAPTARAQARLGRTRYRRPRSPSFRVHYNLACLFSRVSLVAKQYGDEAGEGRFLSLSSVQLENALLHLPDEQRERLVRWACDDPGLAGLREARGNQFAQTVARWGARRRKRLQLDDKRFRFVEYDFVVHTLEVEFADGRRRQYAGVPERSFAEMERSQSAGDYFVDEIKGNYPPMRP